MMSEKSSTPEESIDKLAATPDNLQELLGFSDHTIDLFYRGGYKLYESSYFADASDLFFAITVLNPFKYNVWLALGMAEREKGHFNEALQAFSMATIIDPTSVYPHLYSAGCYRSLNSEDKVKKTL